MEIKKHLKPLLVLGILLLSVGCTNSEETGTHADENDSEQNIRSFLNELLNGPSEEQEQLLKGPGSEGDLKEFTEKLGEYKVKHIKPYLSVETNGTFHFLRIAQENDYELKVEDITLEERESYYKFTVNVSYTHNKRNESKTMNAKGHAQTNEEGKITSIQYINFEEFRAALENK
ncbi:immunoglobulin domain-containing family protein [Halobacillus mangrovi]|uniref:Lipoprotein n=1 Tax=Halobacillus mangrovi TaxID=402384 RepID=A0A1W5ZQW9_9BACI|nr:hypothetical protein [Halobacillus mangrovi]ARI75681.1 hypothetical protein HM131_02045 [Halobacillus mangrovi]